MKIQMLEYYQEDKELARNPDGYPIKSLAQGEVYDVAADLAAYLIGHGKAKALDIDKPVKTTALKEPVKEAEGEPLMTTETAKRGRRGK